MKIKRLTLEEAEKEIYKLVISGRAFNKKRDAAFDEINRKYPVHYGDWDSKPNIEREKAFKEYEKKFDLELNKDWKKLNDLTETTPIAEDKQCCLNCVAPGLCTKRRYVSHNYYICNKYHPDSPFLFNFDATQSLIDACNEKSVEQEVNEYLDKYKKLLAHADECENAVKQKIEPLPEAAVEKAKEFHNRAQKLKKELAECWEPLKTKLFGTLETKELNQEKVAQAIKKNEMCPMGMLFGPVVKPKDKVDYKSELAPA